MQIVAKFSSSCPRCGQAIHVGNKVEWQRGQPARHVTCPARSSNPTPKPSAREAFPQKPAEKVPSLDAAPFVVYEKIDACKRPAMEAWVGRMIGETRRYARRAPELRKGASGEASLGLYVVVGHGDWRYQNADDNEDMGDMQGANWSGPLFLRRATAEDVEREKRAEALASAKKSLAMIPGWLERQVRRIEHHTEERVPAESWSFSIQATLGGSTTLYVSPSESGDGGWLWLVTSHYDDGAHTWRMPFTRDDLTSISTMIDFLSTPS